MQDAQDMFFDVWQETSRLPWAKPLGPRECAENQMFGWSLDLLFTVDFPVKKWEATIQLALAYCFGSCAKKKGFEDVSLIPMLTHTCTICHKIQRNGNPPVSKGHVFPEDIKQFPAAFFGFTVNLIMALHVLFGKNPQFWGSSSQWPTAKFTTPGEFQWFFHDFCVHSLQFWISS